MEFKQPHTPEESLAIEILRDAKLETDEDYIAMAQLIDDELPGMTKAGNHFFAKRFRPKSTVR